MAEQDIVTLIKELAERETSGLRYHPPAPDGRRALPAHQRRIVLLAVGTCATAVAAVVVAVVVAGRSSSTVAPGYAASSPSEPSWFAPTVDYGPSSAVPSEAVLTDGPRVQKLVTQVRAELPQLGAPTGGYEISGPDGNVRVHWRLDDGGTLTVAQQQASQPLDVSALLEGLPSASPRPVPFELSDGVQLFVVGGADNGEIYAASPTGVITTLELQARGPDPTITVATLQPVADALTRLSVGKPPTPSSTLTGTPLPSGATAGSTMENKYCYYRAPAKGKTPAATDDWCFHTQAALDAFAGSLAHNPSD